MEIKSPVSCQLLALIKKTEKYSKLGLVPNSDCLQLHNKTEEKAAIIACLMNDNLDHTPKL